MSRTANASKKKHNCGTGTRMGKTSVVYLNFVISKM